jgi:tetratricopeptide (TPR) repeat protein
MAEAAPPEPAVAPVPEPEPVTAAAQVPEEGAAQFAEISQEMAQMQAAPPPVAPSIEYEYEHPAQPPAQAPAPVEEPVGAGAMTSDQFLSSLSNELGDIGLEAAAKGAAPPVAGNEAITAQAKGKAGDQLREVFEEFRAEMGEMGEEAEDLETHYNLGIAYREMGLLEEAIGEFQKVAKAIQGGRPFRYSMQCYTLLGLAFMDKSQPKIAAIWYEQALKSPGLDPESILAVRYDLGVAQQLAGDAKAALDSFSQVYAMNIDYRDVAERIASLQKRS